MDVRICELLCGLITGSPVPLDLSSPYEQTLIAHLTGHGFLPSAEGLALQSAYSLLLETRFQLHLHNRNRSDWFEYSAQKSLTRQLYDGQRSSYVQYMRHFYAATRICARTFTTIVKKYQSFRNRAVPDQLSESLDAPFTFKAGRISLSSTTTVTVQTAMKAFYYRGVYGAQLDDELRCAILAYQPGELPDDDRFESFIYFRKILALENTIGVTLRAMNELQFLGKFLPEFAEIEGLPQHHLYHYYTVDEHILQAIDAASKLDPFTTLSGRVFKLLPRKELLFLALLFHDIAKHITREGHELIGAECAVSYMENNGYDDDEIELVNFLVRCHEVLYKTITRKKSGSREAVSALAPLFKSSESLDYLFALTCADLSAANPRILNSWKTGLLDRLYLDIREFLAAGSAPPESSVLREQLSESLPPITSPFEERTDQPDLFDVESVNAGSADALRKIAQGASAAIEWKHRERDTLIFIYTPARFNLMARTFGILSYNGAAINRAYAATREDALVRLTFEVNDAKTAGKLSDAATTKIENDLSLVASGFMQVGFEMKQLKQQWNALKRTLLGKKLQHKIGFTADDTYTILSIHYPHIPGLDYQILQKLYDLGLVVYFMKLETDGDSCASTFHLLDGRKRKISGTFNHFIEGELRALIGK
jgi:[protein-PII] uridylyltransferase